MNHLLCSACQQASLEGGVRCTFCGAAFPRLPDYLLGEQELALAPCVPAQEAPPKKGYQGWLAAGLLLLLKGKSLLSLLSLGKLLTVFGSMSVFILWQSQNSGWAIAIGITVCIFIHELGHVAMNMRHGIRASLPMFIPFVGAVIAVKEFPEDPTVESESGAGGPLFGTVAALICMGLAQLTSDPYWVSLAHLGFLINIFNMLPFPPLDGSRIATAFSPANWDFVLLSLLLWVLKAPSVTLWALLAVGLVFRLGRRAEGRHNLAPPLVRSRMSVLYILLCLVLAYGVEHSQVSAPMAPPAATLATPSPAAPSPVDAAASPAVPMELTPFMVVQVVTLGLLAVAIVAVSVLGWFIVAVLLVVAARVKFAPRHLLLPSAALGLGVALLALHLWALRAGLAGHSTLLLLGAYAAALLAALAQAGYLAYHGTSDTHARLVCQTLGKAALGALAVAYASDDASIVLALAAVTALFYACNAYLIPALLASWAERLGCVTRANRWREMAIRRQSDPEVSQDLRLQIVTSQLAMGDGAAALRTMVTPPPAAPLPRGGGTTPQWLAARVRAHILTGHFPEALQDCQDLLTLVTPAAPYPLLLTRELLCLGALTRGWWDEALAQSDALLDEGLYSLPACVAPVYTMRAAALTALGQPDKALENCQQAKRWAVNAHHLTGVWVAQAQAYLAQQQLGQAQQCATAAWRRLPESLQTRLCRISVLAATDPAQAAPLAAELLQDGGDNHWAAQAARYTFPPPVRHSGAVDRQ